MESAAHKHLAPERPAGWADDPTFYPTEEKVGEDILQTWILELLRPLVERWLALQGKVAFVGADQFIYYRQFDPQKVVAPDLYVLPGVSPGRRVKSWRVWQTGIVPTFALEVVASKDFEKDYREAVRRYSELGVDELIIFDPDHLLDPDRVRWQRWSKRKGQAFALATTSNADRMRSRVLGCHLRKVGDGNLARLRLGTGPRGDELVPTAEEAERAAKEAERAAKEAERAAKEAALARVAELEALLAKKVRPSKK